MLKWVGRISGLLAIAAFLGLFGLYTKYLHTLPRSPDKVAGRVHPVNDHGILVYQNGEEHLTLQVVESVAFSALAVAAIATVLYQRRN